MAQLGHEEDDLLPKDPRADLVLVTAVMCAPSAFAICTANVPNVKALSAGPPSRRY